MFAHFLAEKLGRTVAEIEAGMTAQEFGDWQAYYALGGWDKELAEQREMRADLRAGIVASTIANVHRGKSVEPYKPSDFMPMQKKDSEIETSDDPTAFLEKLKHGH